VPARPGGGSLNALNRTPKDPVRSGIADGDDYGKGNGLIGNANGDGFKPREVVGSAVSNVR
jgi:hypothetical protein